MKRIAKRQFFLLGCASLAAMLLSLYDRYGIVLTSSSRSFLAEQSQLQEHNPLFGYSCAERKPGKRRKPQHRAERKRKQNNGGKQSGSGDRNCRKG